MNYSVRPETHELEKAKEISVSALESSKYILEKEEDLKVNLGVSSDEEYGSRGIAAGPGICRVYFNPEVTGWENDLEKTVVSCYGEAWFLENIDELNFVWQDLLASVSGLLLLDEMGRDQEIQDEGLEEEWKEKRKSLKDEVSEGGERFSWSLKFLIGKELMEDHSLEDLAELTQDEVREAGNRIFR